MSNIFTRLAGTLRSTFQLAAANGGPLFKVNANGIEARDEDDNDFVILRGGTPVDPNDLATRAWVESITGVYGTQFHQNANLTPDTNATTTYAQFHTMSVSGLPAGKYRFGWFYMWRVSSASRQIKVRIQLDDSINLLNPNGTGQQVQEPKDSRNIQTDSGFAMVDLNGDHDFDLDFGRFTAGGTTAMFMARFELWRVE